MHIVIKKKSPFSIREQIKRQIRVLIDSGKLEGGQALPSARDLSAILNVNRNTVTEAYKELAAEGILDIVIGSGTFVKKDLSLEIKTTLDKVFDKAIQSARRSGYSTDETVEHFLNRLSAVSADHSGKRILVVDCNNEVIGHIRRLISDEFSVQTQGVLIQDLMNDRRAASTIFEGKDLVVCGLNHLQELHSAVPDLDVDVVAVLLKVDAKVINALSLLPEGTKVGCVCANQHSTETLYNSAYFSGGKELRRILAGYDNSEKLQKLVRECDVIFVTSFFYDRMQKLVGPQQRLIRVDITVDSSSIALVGEKLNQ